MGLPSSLVEDLEQDSKAILWVQMGMLVHNLQTARFGPLTWDCLAASVVWELNSLDTDIYRLFMGGWVGAFHHPAKMMRPLTHHFAKMGALAKTCCPHT